MEHISWVNTYEIIVEMYTTPSLTHTDQRVGVVAFLALFLSPRHRHDTSYYLTSRHKKAEKLRVERPC